MNKQLLLALVSAGLLAGCATNDDEAPEVDESAEAAETESEDDTVEEVEIIEEETDEELEEQEEIVEEEPEDDPESHTDASGKPDPLNALNYPYIGEFDFTVLPPRAENIEHLVGTHLMEDDEHADDDLFTKYELYDVKEDGTFTAFTFTAYDWQRNTEENQNPASNLSSLGYYFKDDLIPERRDGPVIYQDVRVASGYLADSGIGPQFYSVVGINQVPSMNTEGQYLFDNVGLERRIDYSDLVADGAKHDGGSYVNGGLQTASEEGIFDETSGNYRPGNTWAPADPSVVADFFVYDTLPSAYQLISFLHEDQMKRDEMREALGYSYDVYTQFYFSPTELSHMNILGRNWRARFEKDAVPNRPTDIAFTNDPLDSDFSFVLWSTYLADVTRLYDTNFFKLHEGLLMELDEYDTWQPHRPGFDQMDARYWWR